MSLEMGVSHLPNGAQISSGDEQVVADGVNLSVDSKIEVLHSNIPLEEEEPEIKVTLRNVVCTFYTRCHLNLKQIALESHDVEYKRARGVVEMRFRRLRTTAEIRSSGKITCTGAASPENAYGAARRCARRLMNMGFNVRFCRYRVVNVLATCGLPFGINVRMLATENREISYEPELNPGATYKLKNPRATLKIFTTGNLTITAPCVDNAGLAIEEAYALLHKYKTEKPIPRTTHSNSAVTNNGNGSSVVIDEESKKRAAGGAARGRRKRRAREDFIDDDYESSEDDSDSDDSTLGRVRRAPKRNRRREDEEDSDEEDESMDSDVSDDSEDFDSDTSHD